MVNPSCRISENQYLSRDLLSGKVHAGKGKSVIIIGDDGHIATGARLLGKPRQVTM